MNSQRQLLRVSVKLMGLTVIVFFIYILFSGMFVSSDENKKVTATFDVSELVAGDSQLYKFNGRKVLLLHRDKNMIEMLARPNPKLYNYHALKEPLSAWLLIYANDPLLGCEIQFIKNKQQFKSVCGGQQYDLAGRAYKNQQSQMNLLRPEYKVESQHLIIFSN